MYKFSILDYIEYIKLKNNLVLFHWHQDPNVKLIRELREENARLRALLGKSVVRFDVITFIKNFHCERLVKESKFILLKSL